MNRPLHISLLVLPWLLLLAIGFVAWLAWIHFQWKDRTLWERVLGDVETAPSALESLQLGETSEVIRSLEARIVDDCELLAREGELAPDALAARVDAARHLCIRGGFVSEADATQTDTQR